jgi:hypothetical protein
MRALKALEKDRRVEIVRRRLESLEECVEHYQGKTFSGAVRRLRRELLPVLLRWTQDGDAYPKYNPADNEKFYLASLPQEDRQALRVIWLRLEPQLMALLPEAARAQRNTLFQLVAKGKAIFELQELDCRGALVEHVLRCYEAQLLPELLAAEVKAFADRMLPAATAGHLRLKGYIHQFANVPQYRGCSLKEKTVEYLDKARPDIVRSLPGYVAPEKPADRRLYFYSREAQHSPQLHTLIDQTVFQNFHFLRVA